MAKRSDVSNGVSSQTRTLALQSVLAADELATECTLSKESAAEHSEILATCSQSATLSKGRKVKSSCDAVDGGGKDYLTESEIAQFLAASKLGRHGVRDYC